MKTLSILTLTLAFAASVSLHSTESYATSPGCAKNPKKEVPEEDPGGFEILSNNGGGNMAPSSNGFNFGTGGGLEGSFASGFANINIQPCADIGTNSNERLLKRF